MLSGLRSRSAFALRQALDAHDQEGVSATLVIQIPSDPRKGIELTYTTGAAPAELVNQLYRVAG